MTMVRSSPRLSLQKWFKLSARGWFYIKSSLRLTENALMEGKLSKSPRSSTVCLKCHFLLSKPIATLGSWAFIGSWFFLYVIFFPGKNMLKKQGGFYNLTILPLQVRSLLYGWRSYETDRRYSVKDAPYNYGESKSFKVPCFDWTLHVVRRLRAAPSKKWMASGSHGTGFHRSFVFAPLRLPLNCSSFLSSESCWDMFVGFWGFQDFFFFVYVNMCS